MSVPNPLGLSRASGLETLTLHSTRTVSLNEYAFLILRATWICTIWDSDLAPSLSLNVQLYNPVWCREADAVTKPKCGLKESWSCSWGRRLLGAWLLLSPETLCALRPINTLVREEVNWKKNVFSRAFLEFHNPPPPYPNLGNLVLFFRKSKFKIWKSV